MVKEKRFLKYDLTDNDSHIKRPYQPITVNSRIQMKKTLYVKKPAKYLLHA